MENGIEGVPTSAGTGNADIQALFLHSTIQRRPRVSVVVPTYRRPARLIRCLRALLKQDLPQADYEVIVIDDGCCPRTQRVVNSIAERCKGALVVHQLSSGHKRGPAAARNIGLMYACGSIIAFTDDDAVPAPDWLRQGLAAMTPNVAAVSGPVRLRFARRSKDQGLAAKESGGDDFSCANCFVRRQALIEIGGFDERFDAGTGEDADLQFRLMARFGGEVRIHHEARALVLHAERRCGWGVSLLQQRKVQFDALLYKKHPQLYRTRTREHPHYDYYAAVIAIGVGLAAALCGFLYVAAAALAVWAALTLRFFGTYLHENRSTALHTAEMLATSVVVPPLSVFWRFVAAVRYGVFLA